MKYLIATETREAAPLLRKLMDITREYYEPKKVVMAVYFSPASAAARGVHGHIRGRTTKVGCAL